jgi:hemoglobin
MKSPHERIPLAQRIGFDKIQAIVSDFYDQVQTHPTLSQPFGSVEDWHEHKLRIAHFWLMVLGGRSELALRFDPVTKHTEAGFNEALLADWQALFHRVLYQYLDTYLVDEWFSRVNAIGENLLRQHTARLAPC